MTEDEALKAAGDIIIAAYPDMYGSVTFNLQGARKTVHSNVVSKLVLDCDGKEVPVDMKESKQL